MLTCGHDCDLVAADAQQLRDYENAVIQKRFEELSESEVDALMGEIYTAPADGAAAKPEGEK